MRRALLVAVFVAGCRGGETLPRASVSMGGDPDRGHDLVESHHCGACHTIPGVTGANGVVAAPLTQFAFRTYISGELPNTPDNLVRWVRDPRSIEPKTAMPNLGLNETEARDVAAFLYTLR